MIKIMHSLKFINSKQFFGYSLSTQTFNFCRGVKYLNLHTKKQNIVLPYCVCRPKTANNKSKVTFPKKNYIIIANRQFLGSFKPKMHISVAKLAFNYKFVNEIYFTYKTSSRINAVLHMCNTTEVEVI